MMAGHSSSFLQTDADFDNAILFQSRITVWQCIPAQSQYVVVESHALISRFSDIAVEVVKSDSPEHREVYSREHCRFQVIRSGNP